MEFQLSYLKKNATAKVLHSICQQIWKTRQWPQDWKRSLFIQMSKEGNGKEFKLSFKCAHFTCYKVMLKILQASLQQYVNWELSDVQAGFQRGRGTRDQIVNIRCIMKKARGFQRNIYFCFIDYAKVFDSVDHNCGKFLKRWKYQSTLTAFWETCMQVKKQQLELDMEQWTGSKLRKEYVKVLYCRPAYLTYIQSTSWEMLGWRNNKLESRLPGEISTISDMQIILL